jgi:uncharacterized membrane protein
MTTPESSALPPDDPNPYAPPQSKPEWEPAATAAAVPVTIGDVLERTWEIYRDRMGLCLGAFLTYGIQIGGGMVALNVVDQVVENAPYMGANLLLLPATLGFFLFVLWISLGLMIVMLDIARGREVSLGRIYGGGRFLLRTIIAYVLFTAAIALLASAGAFLVAFMAGLMMGAVQARLAVGVVVALVAVTAAAGYLFVFIITLRLSQFLYVIIDRDVGAVDALRISFRITRGHVGMLLVLTMLAGLINFGGIMACGIGLLFTTPYIVLLTAVAYIALSGQTTIGPLAKREIIFEL